MSRASIRATYIPHIKKQSSSGLSVKSYCSEHSLNYHTFCYYRKKEQISSPTQLSDSGFVRAEVKPSPSPPSLLGSYSLNHPDVPKSVDPLWLGQLVKSLWGVQ